MPRIRVLLGQHQFRKTVDGVQGRAYLVAHRVDERRFHLLALLSAAALTLRLLVGRVRQPFRLLQPPDHRLLVDDPAGQQQHDDRAGKEHEELAAVGQPGLFEFEAVDVEQGPHLGQVPLRFVHAVVVAVFVALPHGFERLFVIACLFIHVRLRHVNGAEVRLFTRPGIEGQHRVDVGGGLQVVAHALVVAGAGSVNLLEVVPLPGQPHTPVVIFGEPFPGNEVEQEDHFAVNLHRVFRRVAVETFGAGVHRQPRTVQVEAFLELAGSPSVFGVGIEVAELLAAEFFEVDALAERIFFELSERPFHIGDRLGNVAVGFGGDRLVVDRKSRQEFQFDLFFGRE